MLREIGNATAVSCAATYAATALHRVVERSDRYCGTSLRLSTMDVCERRHRWKSYTIAMLCGCLIPGACDSRVPVNMECISAKLGCYTRSRDFDSDLEYIC